MLGRITYYVVFVTMLWGALAENKEKIREILKSNMTRNDFSNLLKSLIKLNEQRVNVLQKLYRLEDYGVLREVLRSGTPRQRKGNKKMFLVLVPKNQSVPSPSKRTMGVNIVDVIPLNILNDTVQNPEVHTKYYQQQDPIFRIPDSNYDNRMKQNNFGLASERPKKKYRYEIDNGSHIFTSTAANINKLKSIDTLIDDHKHQKEEDKKHDTNRPPKVRHKIHDVDKTHLEPVQDRFEVVNDGTGTLLNSSKYSLESNQGDNNPKKNKDNNQNSQYPKIDTSKENDHNKDYFQKKEKEKGKENKNDLLRKPEQEMPRDVLAEKDKSSNYHKIDNSNEHIQGTKFAKITKNNVNDQGMEYPKIIKGNSNENDHSIKTPIISRDVLNENVQGTRNSDKNKGNFNGNNQGTKNDADSMSRENCFYNDWETVKDMYIENVHNDKNHPKSGKDVADEDVHDLKTSKDDDEDDVYTNYGRASMGVFGAGKTRENVDQHPKLNPDIIEGPHSDIRSGRGDSRKTFKKCLSKIALKLCTKSCITAYKNVCRRLKCTSRSKRTLKKECKRNCKKTFWSSKYSDEDSDEGSDEDSDSDY